MRGLNAAATVWCSVTIGVLAGAGYLAYAAVATGFILFVNLLLRPIVGFINRQPLMAAEIEIGYLVSATRDRVKRSYGRNNWKQEDADSYDRKTVQYYKEASV